MGILDDAGKVTDEQLDVMKAQQNAKDEAKNERVAKERELEKQHEAKMKEKENQNKSPMFYK